MKQKVEKKTTRSCYPTTTTTTSSCRLIWPANLSFIHTPHTSPDPRPAAPNSPAPSVPNLSHGSDLKTARAPRVNATVLWHAPLTGWTGDADEAVEFIMPVHNMVQAFGSVGALSMPSHHITSSDDRPGAFDVHFVSELHPFEQFVLEGSTVPSMHALSVTPHPFPPQHDGSAICTRVLMDERLQPPQPYIFVTQATPRVFKSEEKRYVCHDGSIASIGLNCHRAALGPTSSTTALASAVST